MIENLLPLVVFVSLMVGTPGPANLLMMTGGARYGVAACMPFNAGLILGKIGLNIAVGLGLGLVMADNPTVQTVMKLVSGGYMIWLAAKNWNAVAEVDVSKSAYSFRNGIIVHPLNPKAWVMTLLAWSDFAPAFGPLPVQMLAVIGCFVGAQLIFHTGWCLAGQLLGRALGGSILLTRALVLLTVAVVLVALLF